MSTKHSEHTAFGQQCSNLMCDMNAILLTHNWLDAVQRHATKTQFFSLQFSLVAWCWRSVHTKSVCVLSAQTGWCFDVGQEVIDAHDANHRLTG